MSYCYYPLFLVISIDISCDIYLIVRTFCKMVLELNLEYNIVYCYNNTNGDGYKAITTLETPPPTIENIE